MADVAVKEVAVLKAYGSKLGDFKTGSTIVGALIDRQIRKIKDDLSDKSNDVRNTYHFIEEHARKVIDLYDFAMSKCANARPYIGETDYECRNKLKEAEMLVEQINSQIRQLQTELENAGQHTKNFCLQVRNMVDGCQSSLNGIVDKLDRYIEQN